MNEKLGTLGVQRAGNIADLARSLESQDIQQQQLVMQRQQQEYERQLAERNFQLEQQKLAAQQAAARSSGGGSRSAAPSQAQTTQAAARALAQELQGVAGRDGYVSPQDYAAGRREWTAAGFSSKTYDDYFAGYKNPQNQNYQYY